MEKSTRLYGKRIVTIALIAVFVAMFAWITALSFVTRAPAHADDNEKVICSRCKINHIDKDKMFCEQCLAEMYSFSVDTGTYTSGGWVNVGNGGNYPVFTLRFTGAVKEYQSMTFWYGVSKTNDISGVENWIKLESGETYDSSEGVGTVHLGDTLSADAVGGIIHEYMFFRGGLETGDYKGATDVYTYESSTEICLDNNSDSKIYEINYIQASYSDGMTMHIYDYQNSQPTWVSSRVTFTVTNDNGVAQNAKFYYQLEGRDPVQFNTDIRGEEGSERYYGTAEIPSEESGLDSYSGKVAIYSVDYAGVYKYYTQETVYLNYDAKSPQFKVEATVPKGADTIEYENGSWTSSNVTYKITPESVASGATYSYYTDDPSDLHELIIRNDTFIYVAESTGSVTFTAKSGSGVEYSSTAYTAKIDKTNPELKIKAVDSVGTEIISRGGVAGAGKRIEYASDSVNFTLSNASKQEAGNSVTYSYATEKDGTYTEIQSTNDNYTMSLVARNERIVGKTYYFRAETASGLVSETEFTVTVLTSSFYTDMVINSSLTPNTRGWLKDEIEISFKMPSVLATDDEYRIVRYITGDLSTKEDCTNIKSRKYDGGYVTYTIGVDVSLDNKSVSFEIVDKANNVVSVKTDDNKQPVLDESGAQQSLSTGLLKLDLNDPQGVISAVINGSTISLTEDDWSRAEVSLYITPDLDASISGVYCYPIISGGLPSLTGLELVNGVFSTVVSESGVYSFRLESGAGRYTDLSFKVNIDTSDITLDGITAYTESQDGSEIEQLNLKTSDENVYSVENNVANNVRIKFATNHADPEPHYILYYQEYSGQIDTSAFKPYEPENGDPYSFLIAMPDEGGRGKFSYAFRLVSKAKDSNGNASEVGKTIIFTVGYDVRDFKIYVQNSLDSNTWYGTSIHFELYLDDNGDGVKIEKYQVKFGENGEWKNIDAEMTANYGIDYEFTGLEYLVDGIDASEEGKHRSYNGKIYFRALNEAGHSSGVVETTVKMDTSSPNPLYAIERTAGEMIYDVSGNVYNIYSKDNVLYRIPDAQKGVFANKAPITFYYRQETSTSSDNKIEDYSWTQLGSTAHTLEPGKTYWIYAENQAGTKNGTATKIVVHHEDQKPTAVITEAGNKSAKENIWEFNWTEKADVYISVTSKTAVYFWYQPASMASTGEWKLVSEEAIIPAGDVINNKRITFSGAETSDDFTIIGDTKETYKFKITNLSGWEVELTDSVLVKIDTQKPEFDVAISTPSQSDITEENLKANWYPEAVTVNLIAKNNNPSGIVYMYRVDAINDKPSGIENYEYMRGNSFSTDDIVAFTGGNGTVTVSIRAQSNASAKNIVEKTLTFKIDKVVPTFDLVGNPIKNNAAAGTGTIESGVWTNADEVRIQKIETAKSASKVTYTWWREDAPSAEAEWDSYITVKDMVVIYVKAENEAGLSVTKSFDVKIDRDPPVIYAGKITNSEDPNNPNRYYIDQTITWVEHNLKSAKYNNYPLTNGQTLSTSNVDNSNGGLVHIVVEDYAGNKAELTFYMTVFDLTVNTITLSEDDQNLLDAFEQDYLDAKSTLDESRSQYFSTLIGRLRDRLAMLQKQIDEYQGYLTQISKRVSFDLVSDYENMKKYIDYFISEDPLVRYPDWQQQEITKGIYASYYQKLLKEYEELDVEMAEVRALQKEVIALPATNVVAKTDYEDVIRVYNKYESLSNDQKSVFKSTLYNKLVELKRLCGIYRMQDEVSGVKIDGDSLGSMDDLGWLEVTVISSSSEKFKQAQDSLYSSYGTGEPTKVISIHQLTMEGYGSVFNTGDITITIPIPSEGEIDYASDYVYFGVYRLESDGSIVPVSGMRIAPDGLSVSFPSTSLGTYILATAGNVVPRPADTEVYGSIAGVEIDATLLTYITFAVIGMFVIFVVVMIIIAVRRGRFLRAYNKDHKNSLVRRGITRIPKGNPPPASNPARPEERVGHEGAVYYKNRRKR